MYFFWFIGILKTTILSNVITTTNIDVFLKLAANISDLITGFLIYKIVKEKINIKMGNVAALMYIFNPGFIFNSAIWGQYDSIAILFLTASIYYCLIKKSPVICSIFFSLAWITKPQSLELLPFLFLFFLKNFKYALWLYSFLAFTITALIIVLPFFPNNPIYGLYYVNSGSTNLFNCTSCNALNFWGMIGNWQNDSTLFLGLPFLYWGFILLSIFLFIIFFIRKITGDALYFTIAISMLSFFMLITRMHERYIAYFFPFLLLSAVLLKSKIISFFYVFFSIIFLLNLYIPYAHYNNSVKITNLPVSSLLDNFNVLAAISLLGFILMFIYYIRYVATTSIDQKS